MSIVIMAKTVRNMDCPFYVQSEPMVNMRSPLEAQRKPVVANLPLRGEIEIS
jgi:hypothetical protein